MKVFVFGPLIIVYKENEEAFGPPFFLPYLKRAAIMYKFSEPAIMYKFSAGIMYKKRA